MDAGRPRTSQTARLGGSTKEHENEAHRSRFLPPSWVNGGADVRDAIVASVRVEPLTRTLAMLAGEALAKVSGATTIDASVMSSAALRGDVVYTADSVDLEKLRAFFPSRLDRRKLMILSQVFGGQAAKQ